MQDGAGPAAQIQEVLAPMTQMSPSPSLGQIEPADFRNGVTLLQSPSDLSSSGPFDEATSRTVTGSLPGAGTLTVTATTSQPSPERAQKAAQGLVNFAQVHLTHLKRASYTIYLTQSLKNGTCELCKNRPTIIDSSTS
jgi:hypothetical protein